MRVLLNVGQQLLIPILKESWQEFIVIRVVEGFDHALSLISDLNQTLSVLVKLLLRRSSVSTHSLREGSLFRSASVQSSVDYSVCWCHLSTRTSILHRGIMIRGLALGEKLRLNFLDGTIRRESLARTISGRLSIPQTRLRPLFVWLRPHLILTRASLILSESSALREILCRILK